MPLVERIFCSNRINNLDNDEVCMYEEMMTNNDNVESNLLTSSFIENT